MSVAAKKLTWDDIKDWPEDAGRTEIVDGELVISPTPATAHQRICTLLTGEIGSFVQQRDSGQFFGCAIHVILAPHVHYEPDLCFISKQRLHIVKEKFIDGPPDLIIEVISESNGRHCERVRLPARSRTSQGLIQRALRSGSQTRKNAGYSLQPWVSRTEIMALRMSFQVWRCIMTSLGNMQPSQQMWRQALVSSPFSSRSQ